MTQWTGCTPSDLITVIDLPAGANARDFIGCIVPVKVMGARPLLLEGAPAVDVNAPRTCG